MAAIGRCICIIDLAHPWKAPQRSGAFFLAGDEQLIIVLVVDPTKTRRFRTAGRYLASLSPVLKSAADSPGILYQAAAAYKPCSRGYRVATAETFPWFDPAGLGGFHACFRFGSGLIHRAIAHHSGFRRRGLRFSDCALPGLRVPERQNKSRQTPGPQLQ